MANQTSPFAMAAPTMLAHGLAPLPLGGEGGKQPLISGFNRWPKPPTAVAILRFAERFPDANVGLVCHASNLVVVDIDTPDQLDRVEELFGPSPLVVDTPRGGSHRYFRNPEGIGCLNLRSAGLDVDIKGQGGIVACPPSVSRVSGKPYRFREGNWGKLADLPTLSRSHVEAVVRPHPTNGHRDALNPRGTRNDRLFDHLRGLAPWPSLDEILSEARRYNQTQNAEPEPDSSLVATARQVWRYQESGRLRTPSGFIKVDAADLDAIEAWAGRDYPTALALWMELKRQHSARTAVARPSRWHLRRWHRRASFRA